MKTSWHLLAHLLQGERQSEDAEDPIVMRALALPPAWERLRALPWARLRRYAGWILVLQALALLIAPISTETVCLTGALCLLSPLLLGPSLVLWILPLGVALGPAVVREREQQTWELLHATPIVPERLLLSKARAALLWLQRPFQSAQTVMTVTALGVALLAVTLVLDRDSAGADVRSVRDGVMWAGVVAAAVMCGGLFLVDRTQQFVLMALAALAVSTTTRSARVALPGAIVATFLAWLSDVGLAAALLALSPAQMSRWQAARALALVSLGPLGGYLLQWPVLQALAVTLLTVLVREAIAQALWHSALRAARHFEG